MRCKIDIILLNKNFSERLPTRFFEWWSFGLRFDFWIIISAEFGFSSRNCNFEPFSEISTPAAPWKPPFLNCSAWNLPTYSAWWARNLKSGHKNQSFAFVQIEDWKFLDLLHWDFSQQDMTLHLTMVLHVTQNCKIKNFSKPI